MWEWLHTAWTWVWAAGGLGTIAIAWIASRLWGPARRLRERLHERHAARMRERYPCERQHVDDPVPFVHPAKFEVTMVTRGDEWRPTLVNVGRGDAFGVIASDSPMPNVFVGAPSSWDSIPAGGREPIRLRYSNDLAVLTEWVITVEWTDANGKRHFDDGVRIDEALRRQLHRRGY